MSIQIDQIPNGVREVCSCLRAKGYRSWIVGGCVRDLLLGRDVNDWDICTSAKPEQVISVFQRTIPTGIQHGTVSVLWKGNTYEVTTLRGESEYSDGRRPDHVFFVDDITEDLARRDFSINAIAFDPLHEELVDPFGGGEDIKKKIIRAVGDPAARFAEDGLRILRGARFVATLGFQLEEATIAAFPGALETYAKVSRERIREEWIKTMKAEVPSSAFEVMRQTGILEKTCPMLVALEHQTIRNQPAWEVSLRALDASSSPAIDRIAALLHAVGRARADDVTYKKASATMVGHWLCAYRYSNEERRLANLMIRNQDLELHEKWPDVEIRHYLSRVGKNFALRVLSFARAVAYGQGRAIHGFSKIQDQIRKNLAAGVPISLRDLAINGKDVGNVLGYKGPAIGEVLNQVLARVIEEPTLNSREQLLELLPNLCEPFQRG